MKDTPWWANMQEELRCASLPKHKSFQNNKKVPASTIKVANSMIVNQLYTCSTPTKQIATRETAKRLGMMTGERLKDDVVREITMHDNF